ncbi:hypothetical protein FQA39_LY05385 [Lamprigera yunnana]|nr:hypothetical protein FQA39_LY05385 [Lamprigera yunnana]
MLSSSCHFTVIALMLYYSYSKNITKCSEKTHESDSKHAQANGLTLLHMSNNNNFEDPMLNIFPHTLLDNIYNENGLNDVLIKLYGQRYFRCHKEKPLVNTVSQRMRELARFLIILQNNEVKLPQLEEYLKPCYFGYLINATNELFSYDSSKDTFTSPLLAQIWGTVLKQVCDIAMFVSVKENNMTKNTEIKLLKGMI